MENIYRGLVRNPIATVETFVTEASNIELALLARAIHYQRLPSLASPTPSICDIGPSIPSVREIISDVVQEEVRILLPTAKRPALFSNTEVVREEIHRAFQPQSPVNVPAPEEPTLTYAAIARREPQAPRQATAPPRRERPVPKYCQRREERQHVRPENPAP